MPGDRIGILNKDGCNTPIRENTLKPNTTGNIIQR